VRIAPGQKCADEADGKSRRDDLAGIALYLASKASAFVCGAVIPVDGGLATTA
jgi:NAD(P)-dependent dehydrogenase (short-subunit alcohol dehydrogenase family)